MEQTIALRHEKAQLLGFNNYAELSLATKMADSTAQVTDFLEELAEKSLPQARKDLDQYRIYRVTPQPYL
jgi:oligopeptidase A